MTSSRDATGDLDDDALGAQLSRDGVVVLPEPLPSSFVAELRAAFLPLVERHRGGTEPNRGTDRHQMYLPFEPPFSDPTLWADPTVLRVAERALGPDFECTYYGSDTPYPGAEHQPIHQDGGPLFPEWGPRPPIYSLALNVPLVDVDEDNGPLEWFPGADRPEPDVEPRRFTAPAGTILLRDTRVWHRGSPNVGAGPRPMLALLYTRSWYRFPLARPSIDRRVYDTLPEPGRSLFRGADLTPRRRPSGDRPRLAPDPS
jgi:hypothetical protein